jgi:PadR family transcriptional regulator PadR
MTRQPKNTGPHPAGEMLTAHLLAMLKGWSAYGYDLAQRLEEAGLGGYNKGTIYRTLRQMEAMGLVSSSWETSLGGPARRMYDLTSAGSLFLNNWLAILDAHKVMIEQLLAGSQLPDAKAGKKKAAPKRTPRKTASPKKKNNEGNKETI